MKRKIKKYTVNPDDSAVLAMSVVDEPAVESEFVYLSKQKVDKFVALENKERHMIYGCALRPDFPIYRRDENEEYYLEFSKEAVERLSRNFMVNGLQQNFTEAHKSEVDGITITESWIKADMEKDKSVALGLDNELPVGSWIIGAYCNNADVWEKVKNNTYNGFSVEAIVNVDELNFEAETPAPEPAPEPVTEPVVETPKDEEPKVEETKEKGILSKIMDLINGKPIEDVIEKAPETPVEEPKVDEPTPIKEEEKEPVTEPENKPEIDIDALNSTIENLKSELEALKAKNELLEGEKNALSKKVDELGKKPSAEPVKTNGKVGNDKASNLSNWLDKMEDMMR